MNRRHLQAILLISIVLTGLVTTFYFARLLVEGQTEPRRATRYLYVTEWIFSAGNGSLIKDWSPGKRDIVVPPETEWQYINRTDINWPVMEAITDLDGNQVYFVNVSEVVVPGNSVKLRIEVDYTLYGPRKVEIPNLLYIGSLGSVPSEFANLTSADGPWRRAMRNPSIMTLANQLKDPNPLQSLLNVLSWVHENISYTLGHGDVKTPERVYHDKTGDCDEVSNLVITLLRLQGIPSYLETGMGYFENSNYFIESGGGRVRYNLVNTMGHGWARVYIPLKTGGGVWLPADWTTIVSDPREAITQAAILSDTWLVTEWVKHSDYINAGFPIPAPWLLDLTIEVNMSITKISTQSQATFMPGVTLIGIACGIAMPDEWASVATAREVIRHLAY